MIPSASSCFNRSESSVSEMGATSSRMSEKRVAPASMALTIKVLQRFPSRSAARWKCTQMPSACSGSSSGRFFGSLFGVIGASS